MLRHAPTLRLLVRVPPHPCREQSRLRTDVLHERPQRRQVSRDYGHAHFDSGPQRDVHRVEEEVGRAEFLDIRHAHQRRVAGDARQAQQRRDEQLGAALDVELPDQRGEEEPEAYVCGRRYGPVDVCCVDDDVHGEAPPVAALHAGPEEVDGGALEEGEEEEGYPG